MRPGYAPAGATIAHYRGHLGLDLVPGTGLLAACIPGTFETFMLVLERYGTMRLRDVLEPAIGYATNGHPVVVRMTETITTVRDLFREHWPTSAAVYLRDGAVPAPGTLFRNPQHAATYTRILREAEAGGGGREAEIARARKAWSNGLRRGDDRPVLPRRTRSWTSAAGATRAFLPRTTSLPGSRPSRSRCTSITGAIAC